MKRLVIAIGLTLALIAILIPYESVLASPGPSNAPFIRIERSPASTNWSGYAEEAGGTTNGTLLGTVGNVSNATGSWTVPAVTGPSRGSYYSSAWVGIDGVTDNTVEQIGTEQDWSNGRASYYAWFEMYPSMGYELNPSAFPVAAGDVMAATVTCTNFSKGTFTLSLSDTRRGELKWSFSPTNYSQATQTLKSAEETSAEWVMEAPSSYSGVLPLADFSNINFTTCSATIGGQLCAITTLPYDQITMETNSGVIKAIPSTVVPPASSFSVTYESSGAASNISMPYQHVHIH